MVIRSSPGGGLAPSDLLGTLPIANGLMPIRAEAILGRLNLRLERVNDHSGSPHGNAHGFQAASGRHFYGATITSSHVDHPLTSVSRPPSATGYESCSQVRMTSA